jgi:hypothetical protein
MAPAVPAVTDQSAALLQPREPSTRESREHAVEEEDSTPATARDGMAGKA